MNGKVPTILIVDDEEGVRDLVSEYLTRHGFSVLGAASAEEMDEHLRHGLPDLFLLDVQLPGESGFSIARRLWVETRLPIIMLTAAGDVVDRVVGLEIGAEDYVIKPFDLRELRARIATVLRRTQRPSPSPTEAASSDPSPSLVWFGRTSLDLQAHRLTDQDGQVLKLTAMEFDLLKAFAENPNRVLTRERLLDLAHNRDQEPFDRSIDIRIARIRRKIEVNPAKPQVIKTVRGTGYIFVPAKS